MAEKVTTTTVQAQRLAPANVMFGPFQPPPNTSTVNGPVYSPPPSQNPAPNSVKGILTAQQPNPFVVSGGGNESRSVPGSNAPSQAQDTTLGQANPPIETLPSANQQGSVGLSAGLPTAIKTFSLSPFVMLGTSQADLPVSKTSTPAGIIARARRGTINIAPNAKEQTLKELREQLLFQNTVLPQTTITDNVNKQIQLEYDLALEKDIAPIKNNLQAQVNAGTLPLDEANKELQGQIRDIGNNLRPQFQEEYTQKATQALENNQARKDQINSLLGAPNSFKTSGTLLAEQGPGILEAGVLTGGLLVGGIPTIVAGGIIANQGIAKTERDILTPDIPFTQRAVNIGKDVFSTGVGLTAIGSELGPLGGFDRAIIGARLGELDKAQSLALGIDLNSIGKADEFGGRQFSIAQGKAVPGASTVASFNARVYDTGENSFTSFATRGTQTTTVESANFPFPELTKTEAFKSVSKGVDINLPDVILGKEDLTFTGFGGFDTSIGKAITTRDTLQYSRFVGGAKETDNFIQLFNSDVKGINPDVQGNIDITVSGKPRVVGFIVKGNSPLEFLKDTQPFKSGGETIFDLSAERAVKQVQKTKQVNQLSSITQELELPTVNDIIGEAKSKKPFLVSSIIQEQKVKEEQGVFNILDVGSSTISKQQNKQVSILAPSFDIASALDSKSAQNQINLPSLASLQLENQSTRQRERTQNIPDINANILTGLGNFNFDFGGGFTLPSLGELSGEPQQKRKRGRPKGSKKGIYIASVGEALLDFKPIKVSKEQFNILSSKSFSGISARPLITFK